jgi:hypothetical protein
LISDGILAIFFEWIVQPIAIFIPGSQKNLLRFFRFHFGTEILRMWQSFKMQIASKSHFATFIDPFRIVS